MLSPKFGAIGGGVTIATLAAAVIAVAGMSLGTIWQKRFGGGTDPLTSALYQYLGAAVLMAAASLALETRTVTINGELIFAMAWLVLVLSIGAILLLMHMIRHGEMSKVASLFYLVPAVTARDRLGAVRRTADAGPARRHGAHHLRRRPGDRAAFAASALRVSGLPSNRPIRSGRTWSPIALTRARASK